MHGWRYGGARKKAHKKDQSTPLAQPKIISGSNYILAVFYGSPEP